MAQTTKKQTRQERAERAIDLYQEGFSKNEVAEILNVDRSTVTRYFYNPTAEEKEDFYENHAYGAYWTKGGEKVLFNRRYKPLSNRKRWVNEIVKQEWYYMDTTPWVRKVQNSNNHTVVYSTTL